MKRKALIFQGGWEGHEPLLIARRIQKILESHEFDCCLKDSQDVLGNLEELMTLDLIVPVWTKGEIQKEYTDNVVKAVGSGVGLAGCHGGMCDAFRQDVRWQFMTGGQWVSHPGNDGVTYMVNICPGSSPIVEGIEDFEVCSEQYYMHIDPAVEVLATTRFPNVKDYYISNRPVDMPVIWTKYWGNGRVFYNSLGHHDDVFEKYPNAGILMERGLLWAAGGKAYAADHGLTQERFI